MNDVGGNHCREGSCQTVSPTRLALLLSHLQALCVAEKVAEIRARSQLMRNASLF
uniref:Uncharacterized protein n=1 Tax=Kalanchoe fedtschenkoi TaxID=63787 RepID=A0A7N0UMT3_KALFE